MKNLYGIFFLISAISFAQDNAQNYILSTTYKVATTTALPNPSASEAIRQITYFDGLGRPVQNITGKQANGADLVTHIEYDAFGRKTKDYLPFPLANNNLNFDANAAQDTYSFYGTFREGTSYPYSEKVMEVSPLNRILKQSAPGDSWAADPSSNNDHAVKYLYGTNDALSVRLYSVNLNAVGLLYEPSLVDDVSRFYDPATLYKTVVRDENWQPGSGLNNSVEEFKDQRGRVILKRTYNDDEPFDTYYVYDVYGNLSYVIPPKVNKASPITPVILENLCFQYKYDQRNRLAEKKLPGQKWEFYIYDKLDRVIAKGPTVPPFSDMIDNGWEITKYDAFNRVILTGWMTSATVITSTVRNNLQVSRDGATNPLSESRGANTSDVTTSGITYRYTNLAWPTAAYHVLSVKYYDDYLYPNAEAIPTQVENQAVAFNNTNKPIGLLTGAYSRVQKTSNGYRNEKAQLFYDSKSRVIQELDRNYENTPGGLTQTDYNLDFDGKTIYRITRHKRINSDPNITIREDFAYDAQDRVVSHMHKLNSLQPQLLSFNQYDVFGSLISKKVGGVDATGQSSFQKVDYKYNIRGWLTQINDPVNLNVSGEPMDLFAFGINYNTVQNENTYTGKPLYNGNISETYWKTANDSQLRKYGYFYDDLNRLTDAVYQKPGAVDPVPHSYDESISYDKNGNILTLNRNGDFDGMLPEVAIDNLTYSYQQDSNMLAKVSELTPGASSGFADGPNTGDDYVYDAYGNMISDSNKGIANIAYNHRQLPTKITFTISDYIDYAYNAEGEKIEKIVHANGSADVTTKYIKGFQYVNNVLQFFATAEGYVEKTGSTYRYVYQYKDHLGNIRIKYADLNGDGAIANSEILEENNFYPFGLRHYGYNNGNGNANKYRYNGKEWQDELSLNWYDYGARNYDPAVGRWMNIDPLAETSRRFSPYAYALNNPVYFIDPDGMQADGWIEYKDSRGKQTVTFDAEVNTVQQAKDKGYKDVKQVLPEANVTNNVNGDSIALNKNGTYSVNGGESVNPFDKPYTTEDGTTINANQSALSQLAPVLSNSGDAAIVVGVIMVCTGVGAPLGAAMITYGGYASTTGTLMDLADDANKGTLTTEKVLTKAAVMAVPEIGGAAFKALGSPAAGSVLNAATIGADRLTDEMRKSNAGPYRKN